MAEWDGVERRKNPLNNLEDLEHFIDKKIKLHLDDHTRVEALLINSRFDTLETLIKAGFPGGDVLEHKRYHDEVMEFMKERKELWKSIREKTLSGLLWALVVSTGAAFWQFLKTKIGAP